MTARAGTRHIFPPRRSQLFFVAAILLVLASGAPPSGAALPPRQPVALDFPRLCVWWPNNSAQRASDIARYDYVVLQDGDATRIAGLRSLNPDIVLLNSVSCNELTYDANAPASDPQNVRFASASTRWMLTQVGSTLSENVDATTTILPVDAVATPGLVFFQVGDIVVMGDETAQVEAVGANTLTVRRGIVKAAAPHGAGTRIASAISMWPGTVAFDLSTFCPKATVDAAVGPETFGEWNARYAARLVFDADWDGILLDRGDGNQSWVVGGAARSIDADRSNSVPSGYAAFDAAWNAGMLAFEDGLRNLVGDGPVILVNNGVVNYSVVNGSNVEAFPNGGTTPSDWHTMVFGPRTLPSGAYLDWLSHSRQPDLSALQTYETDGVSLGKNPWGTPGWHPDYRKMRFGLTSALLGDGFFTYEMSTAGHGSLGLMWFDEYDDAGVGRGYLGQPTGPARPALAAPTSPDLLHGDGAFDSAGQVSDWSIASDPGYLATMTPDAGGLRVDVSAVKGLQWDLSLVHPVPLTAGATYDLTFRARADRPVNMGLWLHQWPEGRTWFNLDSIPLDTSWRSLEVPCVSSGTDPAAMLMFRLGETTGTVWLDDVRFQRISRPRPDAWRRDFQRGVALVNPTALPVTVPLGGTFRKIKGTQDPSVNDGRIVTSVTLPARDGIILLRIPTIVLRTSDPAITYGGRTTLRVSVAPVPAAGIRLEQRAAGSSSWKFAATMAADASGAAALTRRPVVTTEYRAVLSGSGAVSKTVRVGVRPVATIAAAPRRVRGSGTVSVRGTVGHFGRVRLALQRRIGGRWVTVRRLITTSKGRYSTHVHLSRRGSFLYRVYVGGNVRHLATASGAVRIEVR